MASFLHLTSSSISLLTFLSVISMLLISPSHSLTCTSQTFTNNATFANCTDLSSLNAYLHWTYNANKSHLSVAFIAPPASPNGWIAWALNPTGQGMVGAQSLIAFRGSNGSLLLKTFNISSYSSLHESKLSYDVVNKSAEYSNGTMTIFATLSLPANATEVNQVWQVGGSVKNGVPEKHEFAAANLDAKGTLNLLTGRQSTTEGNAKAPSPSNDGDEGSPENGENGNPPSQSRNDTGEASRLLKSSRVWSSGFLLLTAILV